MASFPTTSSRIAVFGVALTPTPALLTVTMTVAPLLPTPIVILSVVPAPEVETRARVPVTAVSP